MQILPIASGKGGVGKSLIAANLSIALAQAGKRVILADLDLGGSNIHMFLGLRSIGGGIGSFLNNPKVQFKDIFIETEYSGMIFIPGDAEIPGLANLQSSQKKRIIRYLLAQDADFMILDLGAGTSYNTLDFFLISGNGLLVTAPTLAAALNAYLFLKNAIFRIMHSAFPRKSKAYKYIEELRKESAPLQKLYIPQLMSKIYAFDPESHDAFVSRMSKFNPRLILNMLDDPKDSEKANKLERSCREYLDVDLEHLGIVYRDDIQDVALGARLPIIKYKPDAILSRAIYRIADKLVQSERETEGPIDLQNLQTSYQTAEVEAEIDFKTKIEYLEDLLHSGALSTGDLVETVKSQQFELSQLKRENQLLKKKLVGAVKKGYKI